MTVPMTPATAAQTNTEAAPAGSESLLGAAQAQPAADVAAPAATDAAPAAAPEGVPEKYEFKFPEGVAVDAGLLGKFEPLAKEWGLTQAKAQQLIDLYAANSVDIVAKQEAALEAQRKEWREAVQAEKGSAENIGLANKALAHFAKADPKVNDLFKGSWLGDHPSVIKVLAEAGKLLLEHKMIDGRSEDAPAAPVSMANAMYPTMTKDK